MKETNPLETQLRSWRPRRPSSALRRRLFGISLVPRAAWFLGPLAPAAVCALLTLGILGSHGGLPAGSPLRVVLTNNLNGTAFALDGFANKQNSWTSVTFDSTNRSGLGSIMGSFRH
ncbi:MAG TPA: hypothetical protein VNV43_14955 [Candidatus Acidoferrales bacterium]|nr:hypothetical protein [Candidatus Acidoferrales bacterium]